MTFRPQTVWIRRNYQQNLNFSSGDHTEAFSAQNNIHVPAAQALKNVSSGRLK
jgi:hypothetical protein